MKLDQVLKHFKTTQTGLAKLLQLTQPAVANWQRRDKIPPLQQLRLRDLSGGKLKPDRTSQK